MERSDMPTPKVNLTLRISLELYNKIKAIAENEREPVNRVITAMLEYAMDGKEITTHIRE